MSEDRNLKRQNQTNSTEQRSKIVGTLNNVTINNDSAFTRQRILKQENFLSKVPGPIPKNGYEAKTKLNKCFIPFKALWQNKISNRKIYFSFNNNDKNNKKVYNQTMSLSKLQEMLFSKTNQYNLTIHDAPILYKKTRTISHQRLPTQGYNHPGQKNRLSEGKKIKKEITQNNNLELLNRYKDIHDIEDEETENFNQGKFISPDTFSESRLSLKPQENIPQFQKFIYDEQINKEESTQGNQSSQKIRNNQSSKKSIDSGKSIPQYSIFHRSSDFQKSDSIKGKNFYSQQNYFNKNISRTKSSNGTIINYLLDNINRLKAEKAEAKKINGWRNINN